MRRIMLHEDPFLLHAQGLKRMLPLPAHGPQPAIATVMFGTNDLANGATAKDAFRRLVSFVARLVKRRPSMAAFVAKIAPSPKLEGIAEFNELIGSSLVEEVKAKSSTSSSIHIVDCSKVSDFADDGVHPSSRGSLQCAKEFAKVF